MVPTTTPFPMGGNASHHPGGAGGGHDQGVHDPVHWNKVMKLLVLSSLAVVGTVGNIFAISAILLETQLKKIGNIFIVNLAIADFIVSAFAIPASSIVILAGIPENTFVCQFQWFSAVLCCHVSVLSLMFIAVENYFRICCSHMYFQWFSNVNIISMVVFVWAASATCVTLQFTLDLGPDYCRMKFVGDVSYHATVGVVLGVLPIAIAFIFYLTAMWEVQRLKAQPPPGPTSQHQEAKMLSMVAVLRDYALLKTNLLVFVVFLLFWLPLGILVGVGSSVEYAVSRRLYENLSWLALSNSCVNSFIYGLSNKHFRSAYRSLFHYCCCKTSISFGGGSYSRSRADNGRAHQSDVRVHIFSSYNMCAPTCTGGSGFSKKEITSKPIKRLPKVKTPKPKDVYEL